MSGGGGAVPRHGRGGHTHTPRTHTHLARQLPELVKAERALTRRLLLLCSVPGDASRRVVASGDRERTVVVRSRECPRSAGRWEHGAARHGGPPRGSAGRVTTFIDIVFTRVVKTKVPLKHVRGVHPLHACTGFALRASRGPVILAWGLGSARRSSGPAARACPPSPYPPLSHTLPLL